MVDPDAASTKSSRRGLFRRRKKRNGDDSSMMSSDTSLSADTTKSNKKRFASKVKRFFRGKSKSSSASVTSATNASSSGSASARSPSAKSDAKEQYPSNEMKRRDMLKIPEEVLEDLQEVDEEEEELYNKKQKDKAASAAAAGKDASALQVILLLIDPKTKRFELLQLEYDSPKAKVSDTLSQISKSVTEKSIRATEYKGVVNADGNEFAPTARLGSFVPKGKKYILVGVPKDSRAKDAMRLARPIINDNKVSKMLTTNNISVEGWVAAASSAQAESTAAATSTTATNDAATPNIQSRGGIDFSSNHSNHADKNDKSTSTTNNSKTKMIMTIMAVIVLCAAIAFGAYHHTTTTASSSNNTTTITSFMAIPEQYYKQYAPKLDEKWNAVTSTVQSMKSQLPELHQFVPSMALKKPSAAELEQERLITIQAKEKRNRTPPPAEIVEDDATN
mmetsp:Transcript_23319/g.66066  ORF Transcript_23319/g.66066 Transcript_23319/m.66066 type:complete len:449 (+) Transcript_23319:557-1903(+)|eukprot:CAMPEP_0119545944 /NCGR_PEP_ID=MMETSP1352-20130426/545_1 /TAXON_ID=265584 /ORGANISM="Stauroneis constricta, Strain CCMP1120" /LENGTH=448 /DNA_ID=CAMNT_0007590571 /DNA_START=484 /DNA_END=1830 /DNA_ORIENTATION=-